MSGTMTLNVRVSGALKDHIAASIGDEGLYDNASEYVRALIRRDHADAQRFATLKAELQAAFAEPEGNAVEIDAETFLARMHEKYG